MTTRQAHRLRLQVLAGRFAICRLDAAALIPSWTDGPGLVSITRTHDELSVVCVQDRVPTGIRCESGYAAIVIEGPLDPALVGVLVAVASPLADARIPILAIATFDTDYVLVREAHLEHASAVLRESGHTIVPPED
jgi:hypothetical protein